MQVFIDLDDTIIDSKRLKQHIFSLFISLGAQEGQILSTYAHLKQTQEGYSFHAHLTATLGQRDDADQLWQQIANKLPRLMFANYDFIRNHLINHSKILLTHGNIEFQKAKVEKLRPFLRLDEYLFVPNSEKKIPWLLNNYPVVPDHPTVLIDDREDNRKEFLTAFSHGTAFPSLGDALEV